MKKITMIVAALAALASCQKPEVEMPSPVIPQGPQEELVPMNFSLDVLTKVSDTYFDEGDQVGIYVIKRDEWNGDDPTLGGCEHTYDNVRHTYNNGNWNFAEMYWQDKHTPCDFYCYHPYTSVGSVNYHEFSVHQDQSYLANYKQSDFVWGKTQWVYPSAERVNIQTNHIMSNVVIYLRPGDGFTAEALRSAEVSVRIKNVMTEAYVNLDNGNVTSRGGHSEITPYNEGDRYRAVVVPQTVSEGTELIAVTVNGTEYAFKKGFQFQPGRQHRFTINVNKTGSGVNVGVGGWEEDDWDNGGDAE